jgi:hypothetical protein
MPYAPSLSSNELSELLSKFHLSTISARTLRASLYRELANRMKIPNSLTADMQIRVEFPGVPPGAWKTVFPEPRTQWLTSPDGATQTGLILSMSDLNLALRMENRITDTGLGCTRLHSPPTAFVSRTLISFTPPMQIWCKTEEDGAVSSMMTCWMVLLDESGELRAPPNHTYSDEEEDLIQTTCRTNLRTMMEMDWALSPMFLRLLGNLELSATVEAALEEKMETAAARKRKREAKKLQETEVEAEVEAEAEAREELET